MNNLSPQATTFLAYLVGWGMAVSVVTGFIAMDSHSAGFGVPWWCLPWSVFA